MRGRRHAARERMDIVPSSVAARVDSRWMRRRCSTAGHHLRAASSHGFSSSTPAGSIWDTSRVTRASATLEGRGGQETVDHGDHPARALGDTGEPAPARGDVRVHRDDPPGESTLQIAGHPGLEHAPLRGIVQPRNALVQLSQREDAQEQAILILSGQPGHDRWCRPRAHHLGDHAGVHEVAHRCTARPGSSSRSICRSTPTSGELRRNDTRSCSRADIFRKSSMPTTTTSCLPRRVMICGTPAFAVDELAQAALGILQGPGECATHPSRCPCPCGRMRLLHP